MEDNKANKPPDFGLVSYHQIMKFNVNNLLKMFTYLVDVIAELESI